MKLTAPLLLKSSRKIISVLAGIFLLSLITTHLSLSNAHAVAFDSTFNFNQMNATVDSLYTLITGRSQLHPETNTQTEKSSAFSSLGNIIGILYTAPPVSGISYIKGEIQKFNPVTPAYAQQTGIGYDLLKPVQKTWTAFRNISYIGFILVFVVIGFMVMFRAHISPQAVATVQDSLPRVVIALILVTFSYAIAGLMIDLMFLFLNVIVNVLQSQAGLNPEGAQKIFQDNIINIITSSLSDVFTDASYAIGGIIDGLITGTILNAIVGFGTEGLFGIIAAIATLFVMFRVFMMLLTAYIMIIIYTIFAPFYFLIQALPGNNGAKDWFKQMTSNIAVFPTVAIMLLLAGLLGGLGSLGGDTSTVEFTAGQIGQFPLLSGLIRTDAIGKLIALGFILITPEVAKMVKEFLGVKGGPPLGAGMQALGAGAAVATAPVRGPVGGAFREIGSRSQQAMGRQVARFMPSLKTDAELLRESSGPGKNTTGS